MLISTASTYQLTSNLECANFCIFYLLLTRYGIAPYI